MAEREGDPMPPTDGQADSDGGPTLALRDRPIDLSTSLVPWDSRPPSSASVVRLSGPAGTISRSSGSR